jgi:hypothetical protein
MDSCGSHLGSASSSGIALALLLVAATVSSSPPARADDKADAKSACIEAATQGQTMRDAHRLVDAREQFRLCARDACPAVVRRDCLSWLSEVEKSLPTIVLTAKDESGADVVEGTVSADGKPLIARLDGQATAIDPGTHTLHFEIAGRSVDQSLLVREGEKNVRVTLVLSRTGAKLLQPGAAPEPWLAPVPERREAPPAQGETIFSSPVFWAIAGAVVVGGAVSIYALTRSSTDTSPPTSTSLTPAFTCGGRACP